MVRGWWDQVLSDLLPDVSLLCFVVRPLLSRWWDQVWSDLLPDVSLLCFVVRQLLSRWWEQVWSGADLAAIHIFLPPVAQKPLPTPVGLNQHLFGVIDVTDTICVLNVSKISNIIYPQLYVVLFLECFQILKIVTLKPQVKFPKPSRPRSKMPVGKGVDLWTIFWAVATPAPIRFHLFNL